jgi:chemotaxis protein histidine kinase CheA
VSYLRELARKHLGSGYSKLTKAELIAALADFVPGLKKLARFAGITLPSRAKPAAKAAASAPKAAPAQSRAKEARAVDKKDKKKEPEPKKEAAKKEPARKAEPVKKAVAKQEPERKAEPVKEAAARQEPAKQEPARQEPARQAAPKAEDNSQSLKPAHVVNFPPRSRSARSAEEEWAESAEVVESPELESVFQQAAEPLMEGFFVARLMGERELRRHHLTEAQSPAAVGSGVEGFKEDLGELPLDYGDDLALALARDPHTLFITWDFSPAAQARATAGLKSPRSLLRVFDGDRLVREVEFALESRSFYIHGLPPGRPYRVEAYFVGLEGRSRRIGQSTHPLTLPQTGPSQDTSVRFMQMPPPPQVPVTGGAPAAVVAPRPSPAESVEVREYVTWKRVPLPGSDEMAAGVESRRERTLRQQAERVGPPQHLDISGMPVRGGASEQTHWTPPPSGRGR